MVSNYLGQIQRFFVVKISERTVAQKPQIAENYPGNNTKVLQGSDLILECPIVVVDSFDPPEMTWFKVSKNKYFNASVFLKICKNLCKGTSGSDFKSGLEI